MRMTYEDFNKHYSYANRLYDSMVKNNGYRTKNRVICINIMWGNFRNANPEMINVYRFMNDKNYIMIDRGNIIMYLIRLDVLIGNIGGKQYNRINQFIRYLTLIESKTITEMKKIGGDNIYMKTTAQLVKEWREESAERNAKRYLREARNKGIKIGEVRGERKGILATAKNMLAKNFELSTISEVTGLSLTDLKALK